MSQESESLFGSEPLSDKGQGHGKKKTVVIIKKFCKAFGLMLLLLAWGTDTFFVEHYNKEVYTLERKKEDLYNAFGTTYFHSPAIDIISAVADLLTSQELLESQKSGKNLRGELIKVIERHWEHQKSCLTELLPLLPESSRESIRKLIYGETRIPNKSDSPWNYSEYLLPRTNYVQESINKLTTAQSGLAENAIAKAIEEKDVSLECWRDKAKRLHISGTLILIFGLL